MIREAIVIRRLAPTNYRGLRLSAKWGKHRMIVGYDYANDWKENTESLARKMIARYMGGYEDLALVYATLGEDDLYVIPSTLRAIGTPNAR